MLEEQEYADRMEIEKRTGRSVSEDMEKVCTEVLVNARNELYLRTVSYTHLTLPTNSA